MFEVNAELTVRTAHTSRKRPPNESLRRLQIELPLMFAPAANDFEGPPAAPEIDLEGRPTCARASSKVRRPAVAAEEEEAEEARGRRRRSRTDARSSTRDAAQRGPNLRRRMAAVLSEVWRANEVALDEGEREARYRSCALLYSPDDEGDGRLHRLPRVHVHGRQARRGCRPRILGNDLLTEASSITTTTRFLGSA